MTNLLTPPPGRHVPGTTDVSDGLEVQPGAVARQLSFEDLGPPLSEVTFVVVDLETTGGSATADAITEIGAVRVRGGEVLGEFGTLVDPGRPVPPMITVLTGITNTMLVGAPPIGEVLPAFLEFARGAVLVAHNARFDVGFLRAAARVMELRWPGPQVVDTVQLARAVVPKDEAPNHKLSTLARLFHATIEPDHRALTDARATVDVLHALLERLGSLGVTHLDDLATATDPVPPARRRKVSLADGLPSAPGVYLFLGPREEVLYVGTATNLRRRVRQYFTASEKRRRMGEMVDLATRVRVVECATPLEAQVRELRLIATHAPPYNRRSKRPDRLPWLRLTDEALPRLSIVRSVPAGAVAVGPFASRQSAEQALEAATGLGLRGCTDRLPRLPIAGRSPCMLGQIGRCSAPCADESAALTYPEVVAAAAAALTTDPEPVVSELLRRMGELAAGERFEEAAVLRDQLVALLGGIRRSQRLDPLVRASQVIAARWVPPSEHTWVARGTRAAAEARGGWEFMISRYGRLCGTAFGPAGLDPMPVVSALEATAAHVDPPTGRGGAADVPESELLLTWLERPGVRLIAFDSPDGGWAAPIRGGAHWLDRVSP
ncbi:DEDD exonuclease domain-containing protein [Pseudactinotalea sp. HY160]|uniref:DEDD exonuclease domain-containing protein n=1 Tax=Pseudactinotalea sp. HY160 TaxID=2654490 RepID=UPI00128B38DB|nr:DEDD exonuclease domain-containing protein [Pseudactinotalea sp. HY160]MPV49445.1 DEDD exonuclease domain-containing protein [Pseudactinotalea sp. HY160]